jgi:hypothetical protein
MREIVSFVLALSSQLRHKFFGGDAGLLQHATERANG